MLISHDGQLVSDISSLLNNNAYNDVTIMLNNGVKLEANKLVLSARSKFFAHLIQGKNTVQTEIKLDISALKGSLYLIVKYLYTGKMDLRFLSLGDLLDLLNLTKWMEMDLFSLVEGHIIKSVDDCKFNTTSLLKQATLLEKYELTKLSTSFIKHLDLFFDEVAKNWDVMLISSSLLEKLLTERLNKNIEIVSAVGSNDKTETGDLAGKDSEVGSGSGTESNKDGDDTGKRKLDSEDDSDEEDRSGRGSDTDDEKNGNKDENQNDECEIFDDLMEDGYQVDEFNVFIKWLQGNVDCDESFKKRITKLFVLRKFPVDYLVTRVRTSSLYTEQEILDVLGKNAVEMQTKMKGLKRRYKSLEKEHKKLQDDITELKKRKRAYSSSPERRYSRHSSPYYSD